MDQKPRSHTQASVLAGLREHSAFVILAFLVLVGSQLSCRFLPKGLFSPTSTPTSTLTPTFTATHTPVPTATLTATDTPRPTRTPRPTATRKPTHTPKPTSTPEPAYTPTPVGHIYSDDFSTDSGEWGMRDTDERQIQVIDGHLSVKLNGADLATWSLLDRDMADFKLRVVARPQTQGAGYSYGVAFRVVDVDNYYQVGISGDEYSVYRILGNEWTPLVAWTQSDALTGVMTEFIIVCVGNSINAYVNGALALAQQDSSFSQGSIGLYVDSTEAASAEVWFDDFVAYEAVAGDLASAMPTAEPTAAAEPTATATAGVSWADRLYTDLVQTRKEYLEIYDWYKRLDRNETIPCPSQSYAVHRPSYVVPASLPKLRSIYDRYLAAIPLVDGAPGEIGPLDRIQLLCKERKNIGQADMDFDMNKLAQAGPIFDGLIKEAQALR